MKMILNGQEIGLVGPMGPPGPDGNPIGTIISYMGTIAPKDYLVCDGAEHSISEYPDLAEFFKTQFGLSNHFGGDGVSTFSVPDMRNLFLRGYHNGANEQLSGEIGENQNGTEHVQFFAGVNQNMALNTDGLAVPKNTDSRFNLTQKRRLWSATTTQENADEGDTFYTSRPVNMAVLYCIKAKQNSLCGSWNEYSSEETRIGTWFNKPFYRKGFLKSNIAVSENATNTEIGTLPSECRVVRIYGNYEFIYEGGQNIYSIPFLEYDSGNFRYVSTMIYNNGIILKTKLYSAWKINVNVFVEYTKTSKEGWAT